MPLPWQRDNTELNRLQEIMRSQADNLELLQERLIELEQDDVGWQRLTGTYEAEFSRQGLRNINYLARLYWLKNPLIQRGVNVQAYYVFGQGVIIRAEDEEVNEVVQQFLDDSKNQAELTSHQAQMFKETELTLFGNLFFVFFPNKSSGRVRVRTVSTEEIEDIICNPEDSKDPWYYKRTWMQKDVGGKTTAMVALYPDWRYQPGTKVSSVKLEGKEIPVQWDSPIYHVKVGCLSDMRFGVSEVYAAQDWAKAYKNFLEDWATIVRAYARFAWKGRVPSAAAVVAAKTKLGTTLGTGAETTPPPLVGSTLITREGTDFQPVKTAGATTSADDGRRLLLMVAASTGLPESFFGDVSVGTLATAKSLDRPTELKMRSRQTLWADIYQAILDYVIYWAVKTPNGGLKGSIEEDDDGTPTVTLEQVENPETGEMVERDSTVTVTFPDILEHDVKESVAAIVAAGTLGGAGVPAGTIDMRTLTRLLLTALGEQDIDAMLNVIYPPEEEGEQPAAEAIMVEAVTELRDALEKLAQTS